LCVQNLFIYGWQLLDKYVAFTYNDVFLGPYFLYERTALCCNGVFVELGVDRRIGYTGKIIGCGIQVSSP
jgi:hypothetical protein